MAAFTCSLEDDLVRAVQPATEPKARLGINELLRGVAALMVVLCHYSNSTIPSIKPNPLAAVGAYGRHGVEIFFVISGFVIYVTLRNLRRAPTAVDLRRFLARRSLRIVLPAWASLALSVSVYCGAILLHKPLELGWPRIDAKTAACNVFLCCSAFSGHWINAVYWTLEVELGFYISFSLLVYLFRGRMRAAILVYFLCGALAYGFRVDRSFPEYMLIFLIGVLLADCFDRGRVEPWVVPVAVTTLGLVFFYNGVRSFAFATFGAVAIACFYHARPPKGALLLGSISFSLYLTHTLAAVFAEGAPKHLSLHHNAAGKVLLLFVYAGLASVWAYVFYRLIEQPVVERAKRIR